MGETLNAIVVVTSHDPTSEFTSISYPDLRAYSDPDTGYDGYCTFTRWARVPTVEAEAQAVAYRDSFYAKRNVFFSGMTPAERATILPLPECPTTATTTVDLDAVYDLIDETIADRLPRPAPYVAPGEAITGMPAYLETGRPLTFGPVTFRGLDLGSTTGDATITATGTYDVDWGDGQRTVGVTDPGAPYPDGRITHVYRSAGPVTITVTDTWTITVDIPGLWSETRTVTLAPRTFDLPVGEVQAVVTEVD